MSVRGLRATVRDVLYFISVVPVVIDMVKGAIRGVKLAREDAAIERDIEDARIRERIQGGTL